MTKRLTVLAVAMTAAVGVCPAGSAMDRSVMSEKYWAIWNDDVQRKIDADIEAYRKADGVFDVDAPAGTEVKVEQIESVFRFGAHIFNFNQLGQTKWNDAYKSSYGKDGLFNQATVSFYWIDHEPTPGSFRFGGDYADSERYWNALSPEEATRERFWRRPAPGPVIDFLKARDVRIHGHILIWGIAKPYWIYDWYCPEEEKRVFDEIGIPRHSTDLGRETGVQGWTDGYMGRVARVWRGKYKGLDERDLEKKAPAYAKNLRRLFRKRVFDVAAAYGDVADSWDVVNESSQDWVRYRKSRTGLGYMFSEYGLMPGDYPLHALLDAKEAIGPKANLCINDWRICPDFLEQVKDLESEGARIDIVGCQMHIFNTNDCMRLAKGETNVNWVGSPKTISDRLDMMAKTGKSLHVSEVTIAAPGVSDRDRMIQAILTRNIYRAWFSHPKTMGITWWNTVDGAGVAGEPLVSGLFTRDMKKKPVYHALDQLINHEWRTQTKVKVEGDGRGVVKFRGFKGRYRLSWTGADGKGASKIVEVK